MNGKFCEEHTQLVRDIGEIKEGISNIKDHIQRLDDRINGSFEIITKHIEEGEYWRGRIQAHEVKLKILTWLFGTLTVGLLWIVLRGNLLTTPIKP